MNHAFGASRRYEVMLFPLCLSILQLHLQRKYPFLISLLAKSFDVKYIFVFGGKNETQNLNEVYSFSTSTLSWARCKYLFVIHIINLISMRL